MTKLKTLKDLNVNYEGMSLKDSICLARQIIKYKKCLRQAAIEWVKQVRKEASKHGHFTLNGLQFQADGEQRDDSGMIDWALHFFNLSEEHLK